MLSLLPLLLANWRTVAVGIAMIAAMILGGVVAHDWHTGRACVAQRAAVRKAEAVHVKAAVAAGKTAERVLAAGQVTIVSRTRTLIKEVPIYVSSPGKPVPCVAWGLVRLHDAAVLHVDPATLQPPAGRADDACSPFTAADFMAAVIGNYATSDANAAQLNALEAALTPAAP